jgi:F-type H+-transporting ATPase subunit gamma
MAKGQEIKRRIKSIKSMLQVTKAMELISSIKMRKAQEKALGSKAYSFEAWRAIKKLATAKQLATNPLLKKRGTGKILAFVISSDRGLAGSYNADIMRRAIKFIEEIGQENIEFVTMGLKIKNFIQKIGGNIIADFPLGVQIRFTMSSPIARLAMEGITAGKYKKFVSIHTHFDSAANKGATELQILPVDFEKITAETPEKEVDKVDFKFEPSPDEVIDSIIRQTVRALTYQIILESEAAEHASRMIAMKNASDAAADLKEDFEFTYNQLRQQSITSELAEISAGSLAQQ